MTQPVGPSRNRSIRIFVSSTFRDMVEEREQLMSHTWPALRQFCRERQVEFVEVDLRWGIPEAQSTRQETLKLCLDEIRACRPYFIGLVGERYGWVPGPEAITDDLREEQPWLARLRGKSVTELEILHGVLNNPEMVGRAFFYLRDPAYAQARGPEFASEHPEAVTQQTNLKAAIRKACVTHQIPLQENYPDPRRVAELMVEDLQAAIEADYPKEAIPDALTLEAREHEAFAEIRRRTYIGRPDYFEMLDRHAMGDGGRLVLLGNSGAGKSALLANSTLPGETLQAAKSRGWAKLQVEPLTTEERRNMIVAYLKRFSKQLDHPRIDRLAGADATANPLYLKILLDELRVAGTHDQLDERLSSYLKAPDIPALLQLVLPRYQRDYERDRPGLVGEALGLIWASRRGLSESELLELLKPADQSQLPQAIWAPLRHAMEDLLVDRSGILNFAHEYLRTAVEAAFVRDQDQKDTFRIQLADYFEAQSVSERNSDELPWLLWQADSRSRLRACLLDLDRFLAIHQRDKDELMAYWVALGEERTMGKAYLASFEAWPQLGRDDTRVSTAANELGYFLNDAALHAEAEPLSRRALAIDEASYGADHHTVATRLNNLAGLLQDTNRLAEAEPLMRRMVEIFLTFTHATGHSHPHLQVVINNCADLLQAMGHSPQEILTTVNAIGQPYGLSFGKQA